MKQEEIIRQAVNLALSKFNTEGKNVYWSKAGYLNARELYKLLLTQPGFDTHEFNITSKFESYIMYNIRKYNLFGKLDLSVKNKATRFAASEELIENFKHSLVTGDPNDGDYVIRTKMGNGRIRVYSCGKINLHELNLLKVAYKIVEGVKYYDVRPCLYKNWKNWSDERQQASSQE